MVPIMTNKTLIDDAMTRLGGRSSTRVRTGVVSEINKAIAFLERGEFLPWFLQSSTTLAIAANSNTATLPTDFLKEDEDARPYYTLDGKVYYLTKRFYAAMEGLEPDDTVFYAIRGNTFYVKRIPTEALSIEFLYLAQSNDPLMDNETAVSNVWLLNAEEWVVSRALRFVAMSHIQNSNLARDLQRSELEAKRNLYNYHISREIDAHDLEVGGATDGS